MGLTQTGDGRHSMADGGLAGAQNNKWLVAFLSFGSIIYPASESVPRVGQRFK
jgi:hypothetical protein